MKHPDKPPDGLAHCPHCGGAFGPFDGLSVVRTKPGRKLEELIFPVTAWWCLMVSIGTGIAFLLPGEVVPMDRGFGWMLVSVPAIPGFTMWMVSWAFPQVRRFRCHHCGKFSESPFKED